MTTDSMISNSNSLDETHFDRSISTPSTTPNPPSTHSTSPTVSHQNNGSNSLSSIVLYDDALFYWRKVESLRFVVQVGLSIAILGLCIGKLTIGTQSESDKALYWGGIASIIAWWMPSPGSPKTSTKPKE